MTKKKEYNSKDTMRVYKDVNHTEKRTCLKCGELFDSLSKANRICPDCKRNFPVTMRNGDNWTADWAGPR